MGILNFRSSLSGGREIVSWGRELTSLLWVLPWAINEAQEQFLELKQCAQPRNISSEEIILFFQPSCSSLQFHYHQCLFALWLHVQPGAVNLVLWRHWMHATQVHPVTAENQFHCTRLYVCPTRFKGHSCVFCLRISLAVKLWAAKNTKVSLESC